MKYLLALSLIPLSSLPALAFEHKSGFKLELPDAFEIRLLEDWEVDGDVTAVVVTTRDPTISRDFGGELCRVGFTYRFDRSPLTQNELNNVEAGDFMIDAYRRLPVPRMKVLAAMPFIHGDIVGSELVATSKYAPGLTMLVSTMQTPKGRTIVSCSASHAEFNASRSIFEMIRAGVAPPS